MLSKQDKIFEVENLKAKIKDAKSVVLANLRGLNMAQMTQLREKVRASGGELQVVKNNLLSRALRESNYKLPKNSFEGPNLALFSNSDEITPLKALAGFAKTLGGLLPLKTGFMEGKIITAEELDRFASLPSKIELQARLVGMLASPPSRLAYALNYNLQKLALLLNEIKKNKPSPAPAAEATATN